MLAAIELIEGHLPAERERYDFDIVLKYFFLKQVEIIGEASFKIDSAFKASHPEIPWKKIEGTRHILVHDYFDVDWDILWDIITMHVAPLRLEIAKLLHGSTED
jgi:uncharacterized protein with HEPN domain